MLFVLHPDKEYKRASNLTDIHMIEIVNVKNKSFDLVMRKRQSDSIIISYKTQEDANKAFESLMKAIQRRETLWEAPHLDTSP